MLSNPCVEITDPSPKELSAKRGRPRFEDRGKTIEAAKPWVEAGMSRASWYRRKRRAAEKKSGTR